MKKYIWGILMIFITAAAFGQVPDSGTIPTRPKLKQLEREPGHRANYFALTDTNGILAWSLHIDSIGEEYHIYRETRVHGFSLPQEGFLPVYMEDAGFWQLASTLNDTTLHSTYLVGINGNELTFQQSGYITVAGHGLKTGYYYFVQDNGSIDTFPDPDRNAVACVVVNDSILQLIDNRPFKEQDISPTNELQTIYLASDSLCISSGNCIQVDSLCVLMSCIVNGAGSTSGGGFDSIQETGTQILFYDSTLVITINKRQVVHETGKRRGILLSSNLSGHAVVGLDLENIPSKPITALDRVVYYDQESDSNYTSVLPDISGTNEAQVLGMGAVTRSSTRLELGQTSTGAGGGIVYVYHVQDSFEIVGNTLNHYIYQTSGDNMLVGSYTLPSGGGGGLDSCSLHWEFNGTVVTSNCGDTIALAFDYINRDSILTHLSTAITGDSAGVYYDGNLLGAKWYIGATGVGGSGSTLDSFYVDYGSGPLQKIKTDSTIDLAQIAIDTQSYYLQGDYLQIFSLPQTQLAITNTDVGALGISVPRQFHNLSWDIEVTIKHESFGTSQVGNYKIGYSELTEGSVNNEYWTGNYYDILDINEPERTWHPTVVEVIARSDTSDWLIKFGSTSWNHTASGSFIVNKIVVHTLDGSPIADSVVNEIGNISTQLSTQAGSDIAGTMSYQVQASEVYKSATERVYWDNGLRLDAINNMYFIGGSFPHIDISRRSDNDHVRMRLYDKAILEFDGGEVGAFGGLRLASGVGTNHWFNYGSSTPPAGEQLPFMFFGDSGVEGVAMFRGRGLGQMLIELKDDSTSVPPAIGSEGDILVLQADTAVRIDAIMLQLPRNASDPPNPDSPGWIYYRTSDNVIRWYNGSSWQTLSILLLVLIPGIKVERDEC